MKKEDLDKIKKWLPRGYAKNIAEELDVSTVTVYSVVGGKQNNERVIDALISLAIKNKEKQDAMTSKISTL